MDAKTKIIILLLALLAAISVAGTYLLDEYMTRAKRAEHNLSISNEQWQDRTGRLISEIEQSEVTKRNMRKIFSRDSAKMATQYEKRIYDLKQEMNDLGIKYTNLLEYTTGVISVRDSFITRFVQKDTTFTATHTDGYLTQRFTLQENYVMKTDYIYRDSLSVVKIRKPKLKDNGKKHFPNWGRLPWVGWDEKILLYSENPKAKFTGVYSIKVER